MIHLIPDDQLVGGITVKHPEELRNVGEKDLAGSHKDRDVADTLQVPIDRADNIDSGVKVNIPASFQPRLKERGKYVMILPIKKQNKTRRSSHG